MVQGAFWRVVLLQPEYTCQHPEIQTCATGINPSPLNWHGINRISWWLGDACGWTGKLANHFWRDSTAFASCLGKTWSLSSLCISLLATSRIRQLGREAKPPSFSPRHPQPQHRLYPFHSIYLDTKGWQLADVGWKACVQVPPTIPGVCVGEQGRTTMSVLMCKC